MKYALVIVEDKNILSKGTQALRNLASSLEASGILPTSNVEQLNVGTYLCALDRGLHALSRIVCQVEKHGLSFRTLFFEEEPAWIITSSTLEKKPERD